MKTPIYTHNGQEYRFEPSQFIPLTYMGFLIIPSSLTPVGLVMLLENSNGDVYRIRATHRADKGTFEFYHITGQYLGAWVMHEPEYAEPEYERLTDTPESVRASMRRDSFY